MSQTITVLYFASLSEDTQTKREEIDLTELASHATVMDLRQHLAGRGEHWRKLDSDSIMCAVNLEVVDAQRHLNPADEVAFFPPVTGG